MCFGACTPDPADLNGPPNTPRLTPEVVCMIKQMVNGETVASQNLLSTQLQQIVEKGNLATQALLDERDQKKKQRPFYRFKYWIELIGIPSVNIITFIAGAVTIYRAYDQHNADIVAARNQARMLEILVQLAQRYNITV